jgi:hypothetical protein
MTNYMPMLLALSEAPQPFRFSDHCGWEEADQEAWYTLYGLGCVTQDLKASKGGIARHRVTKKGLAIVAAARSAETRSRLGPQAGRTAPVEAHRTTFTTQPGHS